MYIILFLVLIFAAAPFSIIESMLNVVIDAVNWLVAVLLAVVNGIGQFILTLVYGIINWVVGNLVSLINPYIALVWVPLETPTVLFTFFLEHISFAAMGLTTTFSPIGMFLSSFISDPMIANLVGGLGMVALIVLIIIVLLRVRTIQR